MGYRLAHGRKSLAGQRSTGVHPHDGDFEPDAGARELNRQSRRLRILPMAVLCDFFNRGLESTWNLGVKSTPPAACGAL